MTNPIAFTVRSLLRTIVLWIVDAVSLGLAAWLMRGMTFSAVDATPVWTVMVAAALVLAVVNMLVRPIVLTIARPLGWIAMFVVGYLVNSLALWLTAWILPGFSVSFVAGLIGGIVIAFFNTIIIAILDLNDVGSFYQNRIERIAKRQSFTSTAEEGKGLMMVEIDGLSYWHISKAIEDGLMPTLSAMIKEDGYTLSHVDCGLPSMTSACQAGIMFGDNFDIPAYRWYDKSKQKLYVSSDDAAELNRRYGHGQGLMRGGSSIDNMFDGDAEKSMFTISNMKLGSPEEKKLRANDVNLLMLDPYFLTRSLALFLWSVGRELWEAWRQRRNDVQPRLNRMAHYYPFVRAATCTLLRDLSANIAIIDMMRGASSIYMLYLGYDEVAHHSGPWTDDAFGELHRLDKTFAQLRTVIQDRTPRPYDLIILSDHGQSFGATFKQRYGVSIKEYIEQLMPEGTTVAQSIGGDTGAVGLTGLAGELQNVSDSESGTAFDKALAKQGHKLADGAAQRSDLVGEVETASVTAYGSGNAAQVYFDLYPRKILLSELNAAFPGLVDRLIEHEGIGLICGYEDDDTVLAIGKKGTRNLNTGEVIGEDPLLPYAPTSGYGSASVEKRIWQMKRVMEYPSAGDLWLMSTVYPDGTVAALEELVGSHGGAGGEQTDAFIFHPPDLEVPETRCSTDVFHILDKHRGAPVVEKSTPDVEKEVVSDWSPSAWIKGIGRVGEWSSNAVNCLFTDRSAYQRVANNPYMSGPAILFTILAAMLGSYLRTGGLQLVSVTATILAFLVSVVVMALSGSFLSRSDRVDKSLSLSNFAATFRAVSFAQVTYVLVPLALIPVAGPVIRVLLQVLLFANTWVGAAEANKIRGWRTVLLPVVGYLVWALGFIAVGTLLAGAEFAVQGILSNLGIVSP
jgi:uncharacterized membrane protein YvlD (DUF360 family)